MDILRNTASAGFWSVSSLKKKIQKESLVLPPVFLVSLFLPSQPGLVLHSQRGKRNKPPHAKGGHESIRNSIQKSETFIRPKIIEGKKEREYHEKCDVAEYEKWMHKKGICH